MKCTYCGADVQNGQFCPFCGAQLPAEQPFSAPSIAPTIDAGYAATAATSFGAPASVVAGRVLSALQNQIFLIVCILMSAYCGLALISGTIPVFEILFTVFFWLLHVRAKEGVLAGNYLKAVHTTARVYYILELVAAVILGVAGVLVILFAGELELDEIFFEFSIFPEFLSGILTIGAVILILVAAGIFCLAWFLIRKMVAFAQSVRTAVENGTPFEYMSLTRTALFVFGALSAIGAVSSASTSFINFLASGTYAAALILLGIWLGEHFEA